MNKNFALGLILIDLMILNIASTQPAEATVEAPQLQWSKTFGVGNRDSASSVIQTSDGGYIMVGSIGHGYSPRTALLVKTDLSGNLEWNQTYDFLTSACTVVQTPEGGYAIAGNGNNGLMLVKTDTKGNIQWTQTYQVFYQGNNAGNALSMVQTKDGGFAIAGACTVFLYGDSPNNAFLIVTNANGAVQWNKTYGGVGIDYARAVVQTSDGGYALAGSTSSYGAGDFDYWLVKTDSQGNAVRNQTYGAGPATEGPTSLMINYPGDDEAYSLVQTFDGGYALAGTTFSFGAGSSDAWIVKTDSLGNMKWNKTYGGTGNEAASCIIRTSDGGYAFAGSAPHYAGTVTGFGDAWLVKIDSNGNMQWNQTFGGTGPSGPDTNVANSLIETSDGNFALAGSKNPGSTSHGGYYYLVKTTSVLPTPTPSPTLSPSPSPSPTPTQSPTPSPNSSLTPSPSIPEFPTALLAVLIIVPTVVGTLLCKRRKPKTHQHYPS